MTGLLISGYFIFYLQLVFVSCLHRARRSDPDLRSQEVRVGFRSQDLPIMFRMLDRQTNWGYNRALKTVIPCALTFGIIGYPFVLPDMIGGNGYNEGCIDCTEYAEPELFIRWLQVTNPKVILSCLATCGYRCCQATV